MKKAILALGKQLNRKQQSEIKGGDIELCSGVRGVTTWRVIHSEDCNCSIYETYSPNRARTRLRIEPGTEGHYCDGY